MNDSELWVKGFRCYEHLRALDDRNDFRLLNDVSRCYEQLKAIDDMNDSGS